MNDGPIFLTIGDVLALHIDQIREFGGSEGLRDRGGLESAVAQASNGFDVVDDEGRLYGAMMGITTGELGKGQMATLLQELSEPWRDDD